MARFNKINATYIDDNGVLHIDYYQGDVGTTVAYIFNNQIYYTDPDYRYNPDVKDFVENELPKILQGNAPQPIYEPLGEYVNDGNEYELCGYVFKRHFDVGDFGDSIEGLEIFDINDTLLGDIPISFPDENDLESVKAFEQTLITWLKGSKYI